MSHEEMQQSKDAENIPEGYDEGLYTIRHSAAHIMAQAVIERFPDAKIGIGPPVDDGFYYDFDLPNPPTNEDLAWVEQRMRAIIEGHHEFRIRAVEPDEATRLFQDQPFKLAIIRDLLQGRSDEHGHSLVASKPDITVYQHDTFVDLCRGPHVRNTAEIDPAAVKIMKVAGAYWRGNEKNKMLTRIYGTAWRSRQHLEAYLNRLAEAQRRDHRRLGRDLELFTTSDLVGGGLPLWLPKGATIRHELEEYIRDTERRAGYQYVYTPCLAKQELYETSGHWAHYKDMMFPPMPLETETLVLRPMNCPHHIMIYKSKPHSYRELPIRLAEMAAMYRYEMSGVVAGLSRVRAMNLNDAHIFCMPNQVKEEFSAVVRMVESAYRTLGITEYSYRLSLRDTANKEKYVDNDAMWEMGERVLREAMDSLDLPYKVGIGEAAFYGPKLDIQIRDVLGREETMSTIQVDFHLPNQFNLSYVGEDSKNARPVMIHRSVISTMERMVAYLIELYAGAFPVWLAPVQALLIPVADRHVGYARQLASTLMNDGFRVEVDDTNKRMNAKIREGQLQKVPYMLVVGDREAETQKIAVRLRDNRDLGALPVEAFQAMLRRVRNEQLLCLT